MSKYGFTDVLGDHVALDPSRVAVQIVSGIGFFGGGLIFVRRDLVRGLSAGGRRLADDRDRHGQAGAGLPVLAVASMAGYLIVVYALAWLGKAVSRLEPGQRLVEIRYEDGRGPLRTIVTRRTAHGWVVEELSARGTGGLGTPVPGDPRAPDRGPRGESAGLGVDPALRHRNFEDAASELGELDGVLLVTRGGTDPDRDPETE